MNRSDFAPTIIDGFRAWAPEAARAGEHFDPAAFARLATYEERNFWFRARNALIVALLRRHAPNLNSFLEVGCGTGFVLEAVGEAFPGARLVGSELFIEALPIAAGRNPGAELVQMDARAIPYVEAFDVVGAFDVLEHVVDDERVIANLYAAARPGGPVMATVPQHPFLRSAFDEIGHHVRRYARDELQRKLTAAGFTLVRSTSFVSPLLPIMVLSRRRISGVDSFDPLRRIQDFALAGCGPVCRACRRAGHHYGGYRLPVRRLAARGCAPPAMSGERGGSASVHVPMLRL
jgi:SAM-dependent methyltransferase